MRIFGRIWRRGWKRLGVFLCEMSESGISVWNFRIIPEKEVNKTYIIDIGKYHFCIGNPRKSLL